MSDNNIDPVATWWSLRRREKRGQGKKHLVHLFLRDNFISSACVVSKELNQDTELLKSIYRMDAENFSL
jgi:hypothetical protein